MVARACFSSPLLSLFVCTQNSVVECLMHRYMGSAPVPVCQYTDHYQPGMHTPVFSVVY